jgi:hypothetical protein
VAIHARKEKKAAAASTPWNFAMSRPTVVTVHVWLLESWGP